MDKKIDFIDIFLKIIIFLFGILIIYWIIELILGGSPTFEEFSIGFMVVIFSLIVHLYYKVGKFSGFVEETFPRFEKNIENSFTKMKEDINLLKGGKK